MLRGEDYMAVFFLEPHLRERIAPLVEGWEESLIWSCMQGVMGTVWVDNVETPSAALLLIADFCFLAGKPNEELALYRPEEAKSENVIMVGQNTDWDTLIERVYGEGAKKIIRYAIKKEPTVFDKEKLQEMTKKLPPGYELTMIHKDIYDQVMENEWSSDWCASFASYEEYENLGIGVAILKDGRIIAGASSYTVYQGGIEIQIDTHKEYRRLGLATICGAKLILECLERGWYPSWDAHNLWSVALAEKLGYHFDHEYTAFDVSTFGRRKRV